MHSLLWTRHFKTHERKISFHTNGCREHRTVLSGESGSALSKELTGVTSQRLIYGDLADD